MTSRHARTRSDRPEFFLALCLVVAVFVSVVGHHSDRNDLVRGLNIPTSAESTALYCTGISGSAGTAPGIVTFLNTDAVDHVVTATVVPSRGTGFVSTFSVPAHGVTQMVPSQFPGSDYYTVSALIQGGGVTASVSFARNTTSVVPCVGEGSNQWYASGLSTRVGSDAILSIYNPTAGEDVVNITALSASGFSAPLSWQGLVVGAHTTTVVDLGVNVVNQSSVMINVRSQRGEVVAAALEVGNEGRTATSMLSGVDEPATAASFPSATTENASQSNLEIANPTNLPAIVAVTVTQPPYATQTLNINVNSLSVTTLRVSPSSGVPAAGPAALFVHSSTPVVTTLQTTSGSQSWLTSPTDAGTSQAMVDVTGQGFASAAVVNSTSSAAHVTIWSTNASGQHQSSVIVAAHATRILSASALRGWTQGAAWIQSDQPVNISAVIGGPTGQANTQNASGSR